MSIESIKQTNSHLWGNNDKQLLCQPHNIISFISSDHRASQQEIYM